MQTQSTTQPQNTSAALHPTLSSTLPITLKTNLPPENALARFTGLLGLITFLTLAYALSSNRRAIKWRTVAWGLGLQVVFAFGVIKWSYGQTILSRISGVITGLLGHSADGSRLVFGYLGDPTNILSVFAFAVLPTIIFVSA